MNLVTLCGRKDEKELSPIACQLAPGKETLQLRKRMALNPKST